MTNSKLNYLVKNIGILTLSNFSSKILIFLLVPLYTSVLSTEEFGKYDLVMTTINLLYPILTLNITDSVMVFLIKKSESKQNVVFNGIKYTTIGVCLFSIFLIFSERFNSFSFIDGMKLYTFMYFLSFSFYQLFVQIAKGEDMVLEIGIACVIGTIVLITSNILFLVIFKFGLSGFFVASILSQVIPFLYLFINLKIKKYRFNCEISDPRIKKEMLLYSIPLIANTVGWWINSGSDRYIMTFFYGLSASGLLSVAYKIPTILNTIQNIFVQAWQISAIKEYGTTDSNIFYGKMFNYLNFTMCIICSILIILTKPLSYFLFSNDFYYAWKFVPFLLISSVFNCASGIIGPILGAKRDSNSIAIAALYGSIINLVLNFILIYLIGPQGITIATAISSYVIFIRRLKSAKKDIVIDKYYINVLMWVLLIVQGLFSVYADNNIVGFFVIIFILCLNIEKIKLFFTIIQKKGKK